MFTSTTYLVRRTLAVHPRNSTAHLEREVAELRDKVYLLENQPQDDVSGLRDNIDNLREDVRSHRDDCARVSGTLGEQIATLAVAQAEAAETASEIHRKMEELLTMTKVQQMEAGVKGTAAPKEEPETSGTTISPSDGVLETTSNAGAPEVSSVRVSFSFVVPTGR